MGPGDRSVSPDPRPRVLHLPASCPDRRRVVAPGIESQAMSDPSRSDLRLYERALRNGWDVPAATRVEVIRVLGEIVADPKARRRDRTAAARALLQASRVELDAIRVAQSVHYEDLARRLAALEGGGGDELAGAEGGD
jgi:putative ubiquitin-RnfH superfamily antitoxin RatB of RatAB toxin-antitoxin module